MTVEKTDLIAQEKEILVSEKLIYFRLSFAASSLSALALNKIDFNSARSFWAYIAIYKQVLLVNA